MKRFESPIVEGTKVQIAGRTGWYSIYEFENDRKLVKISGLAGSFQRGHILKYSNRCIKAIEIQDYIKPDRKDDEYGAASPCIICGKNVTGETVTVQIAEDGRVIHPKDPESKYTDRYHHHLVGSSCRRRMIKQGFPKQYFHHIEE